MNRSLPMIALFSGIALGVLLLIWSGGLFLSYLGSSESLVVNPPPVQRLAVGSTTTLQLTGNGFDGDTQVSLIMDVSNQDTVVNRYPLDGFFNTSLIMGETLILGSNDGLNLVSIADPDSPRLLKTYLPGRSVVDLHYSDGKLFVSCGRLGLVIMTLEQGRLTIEAEIWTGDTTTTSYFHAGHLYVNSHFGGLKMYRLNELLSPRQVGQLDFDSIIRGMAFYGERLFLFDRSGVLFLYDCSNPAALKLIDQVRFESGVRAVLINKQRLYVALPDSFRVFALDQTDQLNRLDQLTLVQSWDGFGSIMSLIEGQHHLYLIDRSVGLRIFDLRDQTLSEQMAFAEGLQTLAEKGDYLYVTGSLEGLLTIDRRHLRSRQVISWISSLPGVSDGIVVDDLFYLSFKHTGVGGVAFVDKQQGRAVHFDHASYPSYALARYEDVLFVNQDNGSIKVFDIRVRTSPQFLAEWPDYTANRLLVINDYLISFSLRTGLRVTTVADIDAASVVDQMAAPQILGMVAVNDYLICVTYDQGLLTYRVHANGKLEQVAQLRPPFPAQQFAQQVDVDVHEGLAYIANGRSGLLIVDVKDPTRPQLVSTIAVPGYSKGVRFHENLVYLVTLRNGVHIVDVTVPGRPLVVGTVPLSRLSKFLLVDAGLLYFFQHASGISAIPLPHFADRMTLQSRNRLSFVLSAPKHPGRYNLVVSNRHGMVNHNAVFEIYEETGLE
ncbi:hypothetical protein [Pelovirga terrestris]|uniref:Uncharacterized protein n=1 Tax=Pelovirga terrestris TaxID=2771352 RepID=A0A8J6UQQ3_9BACT|nr:hypothetical protein [Pelovirga terrestris]MBD1399481.1 hypothetical protein [Pelovirga terrestris]